MNYCQYIFVEYWVIFRFSTSLHYQYNKYLIIFIWILCMSVGTYQPSDTNFTTLGVPVKYFKYYINIYFLSILYRIKYTIINLFKTIFIESGIVVKLHMYNIFFFKHMFYVFFILGFIYIYIFNNFGKYRYSTSYLHLLQHIIQLVNSIIEPDQAENELKTVIHETQTNLIFTWTNKHVMIG